MLDKFVIIAALIFCLIVIVGANVFYINEIITRQNGLAPFVFLIASDILAVGIILLGVQLIKYLKQ